MPKAKCVANVVATVFGVILLSFSFSVLTFLPDGVDLGSGKFVHLLGLKQMINGGEKTLLRYCATL